jgi:hypothetical protein
MHQDPSRPRHPASNWGRWGLDDELNTLSFIGLIQIYRFDSDGAYCPPSAGAKRWLRWPPGNLTLNGVAVLGKSESHWQLALQSSLWCREEGAWAGQSIVRVN